MSQSDLTPCYVLFSMMKRRGGISYKVLASLILSGKPLSDGRSPASRINDRSWVSRFIVHAPAGSLQDRYFADFTVSALRVVARLKSRDGRNLASQQILDLICKESAPTMCEALTRCHQNTAIYENTLKRLEHESGFTVDERAEIAMVLFIAVGCTADVRRAVACALGFSESVHGSGMATPLITPSKASLLENAAPLPTPQPTLGLMRVVDGYMSGAPYWLSPDLDEIMIGALALEDNAIHDVGSDVSGQHLKLFHDDAGIWYAEDLGSRNGTKLISGADGSTTTLRIPRGESNGKGAGEVVNPIALKPGDELILGSDTHFVVLEGLPR